MGKFTTGKIKPVVIMSVAQEIKGFKLKVIVSFNQIEFFFKELNRVKYAKGNSDKNAPV